MYRLNLQLFTLFVLSSIILTAVVSGANGNNIQEDPETIKRIVTLISNDKYKEAEGLLLGLIDNPLWHGEATFLLGRLYKERGETERAEYFLKRSIGGLPILKDYALLMLANVYMSKGDLANVIETARTIKEPLLLQDARKLEFNALIGMKDEDNAIKVLSRYTKDYKSDIRSRFLLATLYKKQGINNRAIEIFKDIYISAQGFSDDAIKVLKELKADSFTEKELLKRADNLFNHYNYGSAKEIYEGLLRSVKDEMREDILFKIGMCEFRLKQYRDAARTFEKVKGSEALYWRAVALFRIDDMEGFNKIIKMFKKLYPHDAHLGRLIIMLANDLRRGGRFEDAKGAYEMLLKEFPLMQEDALWGLGWMYYSMGNYEKAFGYLTRLKAYPDYKYLYWWLRTCERLSGRCIEDGVIDEKLLKDDSYYGYLVRLRYSKNVIPTVGGKVTVHHGDVSVMPDGIRYKRIEALALLGMREWAISEIKDALYDATNRDEFLYLCNLAMDLEDYKTVITFAERKKEMGFLNLLYPLGYWKTIRIASENNNIDPYLVTAMIREESRFDPDIVSWAGAVGLMQLMPETARRFSNHNDKTILYDATKNIFIGTQYLSSLIKEFKELPYAIAAYNAGESVIRKWLDKMKGRDMDEFIEDIPYAETRGYTMKVLKSYWRYRELYGSSASNHRIG
ncbi:MAG: transglycosylase SLT domain-containing protein [Thermodesulfovibrionia bacterium]